MEKQTARLSILDRDLFGPDPVLLRKRGQVRNFSNQYTLYRRKLQDPLYMEFAINKIAQELTHFLSRQS